MTDMLLLSCWASIWFVQKKKKTFQWNTDQFWNHRWSFQKWSESSGTKKTQSRTLMSWSTAQLSVIDVCLMSITEHIEWTCFSHPLCASQCFKLTTKLLIISMNLLVVVYSRSHVATWARLCEVLISSSLFIQIPPLINLFVVQSRERWSRHVSCTSVRFVFGLFVCLFWHIERSNSDSSAHTQQEHLSVFIINICSLPLYL